MSYRISKQLTIQSEDEWQYVFSVDEYGTVNVTSEGPTIMQIIHIPRDCIQHFIDALEQLK